MKVKELIEVLSETDPEAEVYYRADEYRGDYRSFSRVESNYQALFGTPKGVYLGGMESE